MIKIIGSTKPHLLATRNLIVTPNVALPSPEYSVYLSGGNGYLRTVPLPLISGNWTLETWFKMPANVGGYGGVLWEGAYASGNNYYTGIWIRAGSNTFYPRIGDGISNMAINDGSPFSPSVGVVHHFAMICNGANATSYVYIDGAQVWSVNTGNWTPVLIPVSGTIYFATQFQIYYPMAVSFQETRIWSAALSLSTLNTWKSQYVTSSHPNFGSLVMYWKMLENSGSLLNDSSGNNYTGTLYPTYSWNGNIMQISSPGGSTYTSVTDLYGNKIYINNAYLMSRIEGEILQEIIGT